MPFFIQILKPCFGQLYQDHRIYRVSYASICVITFICQVISLSCQYFSYPVRVDIQLNTPEEVELPAISICFDLISAFDVTKINKSIYFRNKSSDFLTQIRKSLQVRNFSSTQESLDVTSLNAISIF